MASGKSNERPASQEGLPRRTAIQGIAGSLAGMAALGAVGASAKKKNNRNKKGRLVRFETAEATESIPTATPTTISVTCPEAGTKEQVYATGGGFASTVVALTMFATSSHITSDGQGWEATLLNASAAQDATVSVVCAYFKTK